MKKLLTLLIFFNTLLFSEVNSDNNTSKPNTEKAISFGFYRVIEKDEKEDTFKLLEWYDKQESKLKLFSTPFVTQEMIASANVGYSIYNNMPLINIQLNKKGSEIFKEYTATHTNQRIAIVIDKKVHTAPRIMESISGGMVQIVGSFTALEAQELANRLNNWKNNEL